MLNLIKNTTYEYEGKRYIRKGSCNRCGECCKLPNCPKLRYIDGLATCSIWNELDRDNQEVLDKCGVHTSKCKEAPNSPADLFNYPEIAKKCGFWFELWQTQE